MCRHFLDDVTFLYTFSRKCNMCKPNFCTKTSLDGTIQLTTIFLYASVSIFFTNPVLDLTAFLLPVVSQNTTKRASRILQTAIESHSENKLSFTHDHQNCNFQAVVNIILQSRKHQRRYPAPTPLHCRTSAKGPSSILLSSGPVSAAHPSPNYQSTH